MTMVMPMMVIDDDDIRHLHADIGSPLHLIRISEDDEDIDDGLKLF